MSRIELVLQEIELMDEAEIKLLLKELSKRLERGKRTVAVLRKFQGKGAGVWPEDAQIHVNILRENDRDR